MRHRLGWIFFGALSVGAIIVWRVLVWAFGSLLYSVCLARLESYLQIDDAKMMATLAQQIIPLVASVVASGLLALLAYWVGRHHAGAVSVKPVAVPALLAACRTRVLT
jgi:hypothetical protein